MKNFRSLRGLFLALILCLIPASSFAGVFISVGFAPPILPVYEQPPCPESGWIWTPGYWAYGEDGYYWVPGTWVPAPFEGALWTPPWWGWSDGIYVFHPGYWGYHVGYYGGVNYGFGYMGIGFVGGMWRGRDFVYNTAVVHVDERVVHTTYIDRTIVEHNTIINDRRVAFSGGRDGIHHEPLPEERFADRDRHFEATSFQHSHESAAMADRSFYARNNGGRPNNVVMQRPMGGGQQWNGNRGGNNWDQRNVQQQNQSGGNRGNYNGDFNNRQPNTGYNQNRNYDNQRNNGYDQNRNFNNPPNNGNNNNNRYNGNNANNNPRGNNGYNPQPNQPYVQNRNNNNNNNPRGNNGYNPPPNQGYEQNRNNNNNQQRWNNGNAENRNSNNSPHSFNGGNAPNRAAPQPESRPAPPPPPQQHNDQGNRGDHGDHGDRGHNDRQH